MLLHYVNKTLISVHCNTPRPNKESFIYRHPDKLSRVGLHIRFWAKSFTVFIDADFLLRFFDRK